MTITQEQVASSDLCTYDAQSDSITFRSIEQLNAYVESLKNPKKSEYYTGTQENLDYLKEEVSFKIQNKDLPEDFKPFDYLSPDHYDVYKIKDNDFVVAYKNTQVPNFRISLNFHEEYMEVKAFNDSKSAAYACMRYFVHAINKDLIAPGIKVYDSGQFDISITKYMSLEHLCLSGAYMEATNIEPENDPDGPYFLLYQGADNQLLVTPDMLKAMTK